MTEMDAIQITIFKNIFQSISEEMGKILQYSAFSPNIKERKDFSCALFTGQGESFAFGSHIPVHLGAMPLSVEVALNETRFNPGDMVILNDPYRGGTHLPDITLIAPVFYRRKVEFFVANRAHHSDVGGMQAGSMPLSSEIFQEGLIIPPLKIMKRGEIDSEILGFILANVRSPFERKGDLLAQIASNRRGITRLLENIEKYDFKPLSRYSRFLIDYTERIFKSFIRDLPDGEYTFSDFMDDDGFGETDIVISVKISIDKENMVIDFSGTAPQVTGGINTNRAVTYSAVLYVLTSLLEEDVPINSGLMRAVQLILPENTLVNASRPAGLAGGNVETSQRIVDVLLGALAQAVPEKIPAASQGTMNNISFGGSGFTYYETLGGGTGAGPGFHGESGVHSHMTNSLNTPVEAMERDFPVRIEQYSLRKRSGGKGVFRGGNGLLRSYRFLAAGQASILSERRVRGPYGLKGGQAGRKGKNLLIRSGKKQKLSSKMNIDIHPGDMLIIETPGGGGYGEKE
jgi:N-methylhydantoinase B/oxoprolinase/acetone carboxylase alpha subunit